MPIALAASLELSYPHLLTAHPHSFIKRAVFTRVDTGSGGRAESLSPGSPNSRTLWGFSVNDLIFGTLLLLAILVGTQLIIWAGQAWINRQDNNTARQFLENKLLAEAEALRAVTRNREATQANLRG